jgi:hypothetical protein
MDVVCSILGELKYLEELEMLGMRCAARSGVARFRLDDWQVMIYRNGHIVM